MSIWLIVYFVGTLPGMAFGHACTVGDPEFDRTGQLFPENRPVWFMIAICGVLWPIILIGIIVAVLSRLFVSWMKS